MNNEEKLVYLYNYLNKKYSVYPINSPLGFSIEYHLVGFPHVFSLGVFSLGDVQISNGNLYLRIERSTGNLLLNVAKRMHLERVVTESNSCIFKVGKPRTLKERVIFWFKRLKHEAQENSSDNYYR